MKILQLADPKGWRGSPSRLESNVGFDLHIGRNVSVKVLRFRDGEECFKLNPEAQVFGNHQSQCWSSSALQASKAKLRAMEIYVDPLDSE